MAKCIRWKWDQFMWGKLQGLWEGHIPKQDAATHVLLATEDENKLLPPKFKASLVCFNGKTDSKSSCRTTMAKIEGGLRVTTSTLKCGYKGAVSEITWAYRGQKDGNDVYHVVRRFPADTDTAKLTETVVSFDGKRNVLFEDLSQCILIELQPAKE